MKDPYPQAGRTGPRCSFCGRSARDLENSLVEGPDVWICRHCVREAATQFGARLQRVDGDVDVADEPDDGPTSLDYGLAYEAIAELRDPAEDLVREAYSLEAVEMVAAGVHWHHKNLKRPSKEDLEDAAQKAARDTVWYALETLGFDN